MLHRRTPVASSVLLCLGLFVSAFAFAALMQHSETTISLPAAGEKTSLENLVYKSRRFEATVTSVTTQIQSPEGADPVLVDWIFTASNTDGQLHRVEMQVRPLDESGKQIGWFTAKHPVRAGATEQTLTVRTKMKAADWSRTKKVRIFADWIS